MIVSDVLHEIELGVWKAILTHLIRMLVAIGRSSVEEMNHRYVFLLLVRPLFTFFRFQKMPRFGRDTIRKINKNVSLLQNLAAWDYEDFLQVSLPVFENLFGIHDKHILDLLFNLNALHSFAKLRLHSDLSLVILDDHMTQFGKSLQKFKNDVCPDFKTKSLAKEAGARHRRIARNCFRHGPSSKGKEKVVDDEESSKKNFNINTYKIHALGSYGRFIRMFGTTDSYSTQVVSVFFSNPCISLFINISQGRTGASTCEAVL